MISLKLYAEKAKGGFNLLLKNHFYYLKTVYCEKSFAFNAYSVNTFVNTS